MPATCLNPSIVKYGIASNRRKMSVFILYWIVYEFRILSNINKLLSSMTFPDSSNTLTSILRERFEENGFGFGDDDVLDEGAFVFLHRVVSDDFMRGIGTTIRKLGGEAMHGCDYKTPAYIRIHCQCKGITLSTHTATAQASPNIAFIK
jgi:hypothetical protein